MSLLLQKINNYWGDPLKHLMLSKTKTAKNPVGLKMRVVF